MRPPLFLNYSMILCPLQNTALLKQEWTQKRPIVTQPFGVNPKIYEEFKLKGHEGIDFRAAIGTPLFAPIDGKVRVVNSKGGYGLHVIITNDRLRVVLAHLSKSSVKDNQAIGMGEPIGFTGNTGNSTAPHLHMSVQHVKNNTIKNYDNGYWGGFDFLPYMITWKGTILQNTL